MTPESTKYGDGQNKAGEMHSLRVEFDGEKETSKYLRTRKILRALPLLAALLVVFIGSAALFGWAIENETLKRVYSGWVSMKVNTALALISSGIGLALCCRKKNTSPGLGEGISLGLALFVLLLATATLGEYFFGWELKIDELIFQDKNMLPLTSQPGRMSPTSGLCLILSGLGLAVLSRTLSARISLPLLKTLGMALMVISTYTLLGFWLEALELNWSVSTGMALHTALSFALLGIGFSALAFAEDGFSWSLSLPVTLGFGCGIALMLLDLSLGYSSTVRLMQTDKLVADRQEVLVEIHKFFATNLNSKNDQGTRTMTGAAGGLESGEAMLKTLKRIRALIHDDPEMKQFSDALGVQESKLLTRRAENKNLISAQATNGIPDIAAVPVAMDPDLEAQFWSLIRSIETAEVTLLEDSKKQAVTASTVVILLLPLGIFLSLSILLWGLFNLDVGVAARERTETQLRASLKNLQELQCALDEHTYVAIIDAEKKICYVNDKLCAISHYRREELLGQCYQMADSEYHPKAFIQDLWKTIAQGEPWHDAVKNRAKDGSVFWVETTIVPFSNFRGRPDRYIVIGTDITESKRMDETVRESERYFRFLNKLVEETRSQADPHGVMATTARTLGQHLGASRCAYAEVEPDGEQFTILHDYTDGCASTEGSYQLSLFGPQAVATLRQGEALILRDIGNELLPDEGADMFQAIGIEAIIVCPLVKDGVLRAMMAVHQTVARDWQSSEIKLVKDVVERCWATIERQKAEEVIRKLNADLEERVGERTRQLEEANKELAAFSYSVSHDLRAPLRAVDGFSQAVLEDYGPQLPEEGQHYLQTIRASAQAMARLIDDLLTFSRLSRKGVSPQTLAMRKLVEEVWAELEDEWRDRALTFQIAEMPDCQGDPALLKQVWMNLLSNAIKYTRNREPAVVEVGSTEREGERVFFVRDNGAGFDMRYVDKIFGVFQRLHRAEDFEGTGVGLAIVQRIIHRHGGRIWAEAVLDRGATFSFTLDENPPV